jgi:hypothetical protein
VWVFLVSTGVGVNIKASSILNTLYIMLVSQGHLFSAWESTCTV